MSSKKYRKKIVQIINNQMVQSIIYNPFSDFIDWSILNFVKRVSQKMPIGMRILDAGAGELRYKKYFSHCDYVSQDLCIGEKEWYFNEIDIKSDICNIPVKNESFDYILCTQVLEHLEFPERAFKEFYRILKKGGKLILTAPLGFGEHQIPYDFFRYTKYGLKSLGERNNLELISLKPQGGVFINLEYILWQSISIFIPFKDNTIIRYFFFILLFAIKFISGVFFCFLDIFDKNKFYTNNYNCIYEKIR